VLVADLRARACVGRADLRARACVGRGPPRSSLCWSRTSAPKASQTHIWPTPDSLCGLITHKGYAWEDRLRRNRGNGSAVPRARPPASSRAERTI